MANARTTDNDQDGDKPAYDVAEFRTSASDAHGHGERVFCRVMPQIAQQFEVLVQSKRFPYRTKADLIRHALYRHVKWLEGLEPVKSVMSQVDATIAVLAEEEQQHEFRGVLEKMSAQISNHISSGAEGEARRLVLKVQALMREAPDCYWRNRYLGEIDSRWKHLIDSAPRAGLIVGAGGGDGE